MRIAHSLGSLLAALCLATTIAHGDVVREMTPAQTKAAIAAADEAWKGREPGSTIDTSYSCAVGREELGRPVMLRFSTPYARVYESAIAAKRAYKTLASTAVEPWRLEPVVYVYVPTANIGGTIISPRSVVLIDQKGAVTQPTKLSKDRQVFQNGFGAIKTGNGLFATFPLSALRDGSSFHVRWLEDDEGICKLDLGDVQ